MKTRPTILFVFTKPTRLVNKVIEADSPGTVYCRITVRGTRAMISTGIRLTYQEWDAKASRVLYQASLPGGLSKKATQLANEQLTKMRDELTDLAADLNRQQKPVTANRLRQLYLHPGAVLSLLGMYEAWLAERKTLVGLEISASSLKIAQTRLNKFRAFLTAHNMLAMRPEEFTHTLADKLLYWLLGPQGFQRNTALKNVQNVSQVLRWAVRRELLDKNPLALYSYKMAEAKPIVYLTSEEVAHLSQLPLAAKKLQAARDGFILQCWTGLAYADLAALDLGKQAEVLPDGRRVLRVRRQKSTTTHGYECLIPLLPEAERILARYGDKVPVYSNQRFNFYLKQLGELAGLAPEQMSTHVGRKTAGVMMLNAGLRMEVVSKFLGHSSVKMTEKIYAKILDKTLLAEFDRVFTLAPLPPAPVGRVAPLAPEPAREGGRVLPLWGGGRAA